jgi:hypothetical protein
MLESLGRIAKGTVVGLAVLLVLSALSYKLVPVILAYPISPEKALVMGTILLLTLPGISVSIYSLWRFFTGDAMSFGVSGKLIKSSKKTPKSLSGKIIVLASRIHLLIFGIGFLLANLYYADTAIKLWVLI